MRGKHWWIIILLGIAVPVLGSYQFSRINANEGVGIEVSGTTQLFLNTQSAALPTGVTRFGYYMMDEDGNFTGIATAIDVARMTSPGSVELGSFQAGDRIAFWMETEDGLYLDSYHRDRKGDTRFAVYDGNNGKNNTSVLMGIVVADNGWSPSGDYSDVFSFNVTDVPSYMLPTQQTGQPLPGVAVTLCLSAAGFGWLKRNRRR